MLRKREKFINKWTLILWLVLAIVACIISVEMFIVLLAVIFEVFMVSGIVSFVRGWKVARKTSYKQAYKYYRGLRRRLFFMGYRVDNIFDDVEATVDLMNYWLTKIVDGKTTITSIDIAAAIIYSVVTEDDSKEFMFDVFRCVMDKIAAPEVYKVSHEWDAFGIEKAPWVMDKADIKKYIKDTGKDEFMRMLKRLYDNDQTLSNQYLHHIYECAKSK